MNKAISDGFPEHQVLKRAREIIRYVFMYEYIEIRIVYGCDLSVRHVRACACILADVFSV